MTKLVKRGLNVVHVQGKRPHQYACFLARAKVLVNVHFMLSGQKTFRDTQLEEFRIALGLSSGVTIVSERSGDTNVDNEYEKHVVFSSYDAIPEQCVRICQTDPKKLNRSATQAREWFRTKRSLNSLVNLTELIQKGVEWAS